MQTPRKIRPKALELSIVSDGYAPVNPLAQLIAVKAMHAARAALKSGARHSADDLTRLRAIADAQTGIGTHVEAIAGALKDLGVTGAHGLVEGEQGPDQQSGPDSAVHADDAQKGRFDPSALARFAISIAAQNLTAQAQPVPTHDQIQKCGGGVGGYLKAFRALQRGQSV